MPPCCAAAAPAAADREAEVQSAVLVLTEEAEKLDGLLALRRAVSLSVVEKAAADKEPAGLTIQSLPHDVRRHTSPRALCSPRHDSHPPPPPRLRSSP